MNNIINVETGDKWFLEILHMYPEYYQKKYDKLKRALQYNIQNEYKPSRCKGFCPYCNECQHCHNILDTVIPIRNKMVQIENYNADYSSLEEAQDDTYNAILKAYRAEDDSIYVIKAQCSIGKSTSYLKIMKDNSDVRFIIAAPTNLLKKELYLKAKVNGIDVRRTPSLEDIKDDMPIEVWSKIQRMYTRGQSKKVHPYIDQYLKTHNVPCLKKYMEKRKKLKTFKGSIITTHRYLLSMDEERLSEFDTVIIDEDIIFKSIVSNQGEITVSKLKKILRTTTDVAVKNKIKKLLKLLKSGHRFIKPDGFELSDEDNDYKYDMVSFCLAEFF